MTDSLPRVLFFNINGSGTGHLTRCLAYARRMRGRARPLFFSLASAIEVIEEMGFEADYFVSHFWSSSHINAWNRELAVRFGMLLDAAEPQVVVFDGTWPYHGFMDACDERSVPLKVWSNRGLHRKDFPPVPIKETAFDLVLKPGEIGTTYAVDKAGPPGRVVSIPPVTLLDDGELLDRAAARDRLGLEQDGRYALFSLGPGNLKDINDLAGNLLAVIRKAGFQVVWAKAPISVSDVALPDDVISISEFPLVRSMRAFDIFAGAAGYNTCFEVIQSGVPSLLVPNTLVADDQTRRAAIVALHAPAVISPCDTVTECETALAQLLAGTGDPDRSASLQLDGALQGANEILRLAGSALA